MSKFEVTLEVIVTCPVKVVIDAEDKSSAIEAASELFSYSVADALETKSAGWKAYVRLTPPKGAEVANDKARAMTITLAGGGEKARKLPDEP